MQIVSKRNRKEKVLVKGKRVRILRNPLPSSDRNMRQLLFFKFLNEYGSNYFKKKKKEINNKLLSLTNFIVNFKAMVKIGQILVNTSN